MQIHMVSIWVCLARAANEGGPDGLEGYKEEEEVQI